MLEEDDLLNPLVELMGGGLRSDEFLNEVEFATASCMQLRGWTYEPVLISQAPEPLTVGEKRRQVMSYGYMLHSQPPSPADTGTSASDRNNDRLALLDSQARTKYFADLDGGVGEGDPPPDSCRGLAQAETGSVVFNAAASAEGVDLQQGMRESPEGLAVRREYSECMGERGYEVDVPADAFIHAVEATEGLPTSEAISLEIRIATDDFECGLPTVLAWEHHIGAEVARILIERYPELARD